MGRLYGCEHPEKFGGLACAACLAEAYDLVDEAWSILNNGAHKIEPTHQVLDWKDRYGKLRRTLKDR